MLMTTPPAYQSTSNVPRPIHFVKLPFAQSRRSWHTCNFMILLQDWPCQNVPGAGNFAAFSQFLATYSTLYFTSSPLAGKGLLVVCCPRLLLCCLLLQNISTGPQDLYSSIRIVPPNLSHSCQPPCSLFYRLLGWLEILQVTVFA